MDRPTDWQTDNINQYARIAIQPKRYGSHINLLEDLYPLQDLIFLPSFVEFQEAVRGQLMRSQGGHFVFELAQKTQTWERTLRSCFLSSFVAFCSGVSEMKLKIFLIDQKNTKVVEDIEILLLVKFCWITFSGSRGEAENVSVNQKPRQPAILFFWSAQKTQTW